VPDDKAKAASLGTFRKFLALQLGGVLVLTLVGSAYFYDNAFHYTKRMRGPAFSQNDVDHISHLPVQAPYDDLDVYSQVYQHLHRDREWPALGQAHRISQLQLALGQPVALAPTVRDIVVPEFGAKKRLEQAQLEFKNSGFSVRPIRDESLPIGTLHHYPVRPGEKYFVYAGRGLWSLGEVYQRTQEGPLSQPDSMPKPGYYFPVRVTYLGHTPIKGVILQVHVQRPRELLMCFPQRYNGKVYTTEYALKSGDSIEGLCPLTEQTRLELSEAALYLKKMDEDGQPNHVGILQQFEFESIDSPSPYAQGLLARAEWIPPNQYECGNNLLCRGNKWLFQRHLLQFIANSVVFLVIAGASIGSVVAALSRSVSGSYFALFGLSVVGVAGIIFVLGGLVAMLAIYALPWFAFGYVVGERLTIKLLVQPSSTST
jgi:hypothetical protein